jgi:hypothetical protein
MSCRATVLAVAALAPLLSGCWLQPDFGPEHQSYNASETTLTREFVGTLHEAWSAPSGISGQPLVASGSVFLGGSEGGDFLVRALDRSTGARRWERNFGAADGFGGLLSVAGDQVVVGRTSEIATLDPATGATLETAGELVLDADTAVVAGDVIAYRALRLGQGGGNRLVVRDRTTLQERWTAPIEPFGIGQFGETVSSQGNLYLRDSDPTSGDAVIKAFPLAGCGAASCSPTATFPVPAPSAPLTTSDVQLLAATDDGDLLLKRSASDSRGTAFANDLVAVTSTGTLDWTLPLLTLDGVAVAGGTVFATGTDAASTREGTLFARSDSATWRVDEFEWGQPIVAADLVFVPSQPSSTTAGESVEIVAAEGCGDPACTELMTYDLDGSGGIYGMSVSNGTLFVNKAGPDGGLYALRR